MTDKCCCRPTAEGLDLRTTQRGGLAAGRGVPVIGGHAGAGRQRVADGVHLRVGAAEVREAVEGEVTMTRATVWG